MLANGGLRVEAGEGFFDEAEQAERLIWCIVRKVGEPRIVNPASLASRH